MIYPPKVNFSKKNLKDSKVGSYKSTSIWTKQNLVSLRLSNTDGIQPFVIKTFLFVKNFFLSKSKLETY